MTFSYAYLAAAQIEQTMSFWWIMPFLNIFQMNQNQLHVLGQISYGNYRNYKGGTGGNIKCGILNDPKTRLLATTIKRERGTQRSRTARTSTSWGALIFLMMAYTYFFEMPQNRIIPFSVSLQFENWSRVIFYAPFLCLKILKCPIFRIRSELFDFGAFKKSKSFHITKLSFTCFLGHFILLPVGAAKIASQKSVLSHTTVHRVVPQVSVA